MFAVPHVIIVDHPDSGSDGADLAAYASAMQRQLDVDFAPIYQRTAIVNATPVAIAAGVDPGAMLKQMLDQIDPDAWVLGLFSDPDQPGALGYHAVGPNNMPYGKIFPKLDKADGANLSTTIDHELLEMLEDFLTDLGRQGADGHFWADEPGDAVEQDEYEIDGVKLSNFVWPSWYSGTGDKYDQLGTCKEPLTVTPGGYAQYYDNATGWQQITHASKAPRAYRRMEFGRSTKRRARAMPNLHRPGIDERFEG